MASPRPANAVQPAPANLPGALLSLIGGQRVINLAELAQAIAADRNLSCRVTTAACREFGRPWLSVEQAIVLLGRERVASQILRFLHPNRNPSTERLPLPELLQGISD